MMMRMAEIYIQKDLAQLSIDSREKTWKEMDNYDEKKRNACK